MLSYLNHESITSDVIPPSEEPTITANNFLDFDEDKVETSNDTITQPRIESESSESINSGTTVKKTVIPTRVPRSPAIKTKNLFISDFRAKKNYSISIMETIFKGVFGHHKKGLNLSIPVRWKLILGGVHIGFNKSLKVYPSEHNLTTRNFA